MLTLSSCILNFCLLAPRLNARLKKRPVKQGKTRGHARTSSADSSSEENTKTILPRRSRRAVASSNLVGFVNYSETRVSKRKQKRKFKKTKTENNSESKKSLNNQKLNKIKLKIQSEGNNSSSNDTDNSSSSVDANNNLTANRSKLITTNHANKLKHKIPSESVFLEKLIKFMEKHKTPIQRVPNLGFKKSIFLIHFFKY